MEYPRGRLANLEKKPTPFFEHPILRQRRSWAIRYALPTQRHGRFNGMSSLERQKTIFGLDGIPTHHEEDQKVIDRGLGNFSAIRPFLVPHAGTACPVPWVDIPGFSECPTNIRFTIGNPTFLKLSFDEVLNGGSVCRLRRLYENCRKNHHSQRKK
jgi:hypothetical protein